MKHTRLSQERPDTSKSGRPTGRLGRDASDEPTPPAKKKTPKSGAEPKTSRKNEAAIVDETHELVEDYAPRDAAAMDSLLKLFVYSPDEPITQQIVDRICELISLGVLQPGDRLPPLKRLADHLGSNTFSVMTAYRKLQEMNVSTSVDKTGSFVGVLPGAPQIIAIRMISQAVHQCRQLGLSKNGISTLFESQLERHFNERRATSGKTKTTRSKPSTS